MPRLSLGKIEQALANPAAFRAQLDAGGGGGFGYTYHAALRNGIYRFHSTADANDAIDYLDRSIRESAKLTSVARRQATVEKLEWYTEEYLARGWPTFSARLRLEIPVPLRAAGSLTCTGEIGRVDLKPSGGYAAWLFPSEVDANWRDELRMPLLQRFLARDLGAPPSDIDVGMYDFINRGVVSVQYDDLSLAAAERRFRRLVRQLGY